MFYHRLISTCINVRLKIIPIAVLEIIICSYFIWFFLPLFLTPQTQHFNHGPVNLEVLEWQHVSDNIIVINLRPPVSGSISILRWKLRECMRHFSLHTIELSQSVFTNYQPNWKFRFKIFLLLRRKNKSILYHKCNYVRCIGLKRKCSMNY